MTDFDKNTWQTPQYVFNWLQSKFGWFDLDGCANYKNALCYRYVGEPAPEGYWDSEDESPFLGNISIAPDFLGSMIFVFDPCADDFVQRTVSIGHVQDCGGYGK